MMQTIADLSQRLKSNPGDETALFALFKAVRNQGLVEELLVLLELWSEAERGDGVLDRAMAALLFRIAVRSTETHARELCRRALDLYPGHVGALLLFDSLVDGSWADEVGARSQLLFEEAAPGSISAEVREALSHRLAEAARYETLLNGSTALSANGETREDTNHDRAPPARANGEREVTAVFETENARRARRPGEGEAGTDLTIDS